ncbi:MAG: CvpA family protein [Lachnospiraceae bacterium]|nr:CvpA family protein [Lachnospiraceae bacterium]
MNGITIVVLLVFLVFIGLGFARGLIKSIFKIVITALAMLLAYLISPIISGLIIEYTNIDNSIRNKIYTTIEEKVEEKIREEVSENIGQLDGALAEQLTQQYLEQEPNRNTQIDFIQNMKIPEFLKKALIDNNHSEMKQEIGVTTFYDYVSTYLARMVVNAIGFFCTFLFLMLLFNVTLLLLNMVMKLPGLNMVNRLGGAAFGFVEALLIVWIVFILIDMAVGTKLGGSLMQQISDSKLLTIIYDKNILAQFVENIIRGI